MEEVLSDPTPPTAVFAENWHVCEALLAAVGARGWQVPEEVSLIGYGQNVLQMASPVAITAYVPDSEAIGERAVNLLCDRIDGKEPSPAPVAVPGHLVERDSVRTLEKVFTE
jgi:DNA-binding LacI/PurR family transcriptional regulator